jgi:hypothetical protein
MVELPAAARDKLAALEAARMQAEDGMRGCFLGGLSWWASRG